MNTKIIKEALEYKDLVGLVKPTVFIDEFDAKMGDNADVIVLSFYVRDNQASKDLMNWFEKGYDFVIDSDVSPGEIKPGRYLVYVEIRRRGNAGQNVWQLLSDLSTLTEFEPDDWTMVYRKKEKPFDRDVFDKMVPRSPKDYKIKIDGDLNEMRQAAGLPVKTHWDRDDPELKMLQSIAGIR